MEAELDYAYPDYAIKLTFTAEEIDCIVNKGSLEDYHEDKIMELLRAIYQANIA